MARRTLSLWGPVVAYMALIYVLSDQPHLPVTDRVSDKLLHAVAYAVLGVLALRATHGKVAPARSAPSSLAGLFTVLYGVLDEIHQAFVPGRNPAVMDAVADTVGFVVALALWGFVLGVGRFRGSFARRRD